MKRLLPALIAVFVMASPAWAARPPHAAPLNLEIAGPSNLAAAPQNPAGALLSLVFPGGGQFYAGDPVRGYVYLGVGLGSGLLGFGAMIAQVPGGWTSAEETALSGLVGYGVLLIVETVSAIDAFAEINGEQGDEAAASPALPLPVTIPASAAQAPPPPVQPPIVPVPHVAVPVAPRPAPRAHRGSLDTDSQLVLQAYRQAGAGDHVAAVQTLHLIHSPGFAPKVAALERQWGPQAATELVSLAAQLANQGKTKQAIAALSEALSLPADPAVRQRALALRDRLTGPALQRFP